MGNKNSIPGNLPENLPEELLSPLNVPENQLADLRCLECKNLLTYLPITFYPNVGNLCGRCTPYVAKISLNGSNIQGIKNAALEALIKLIPYLPCRYKQCSEVMINTFHIPFHEANCKYRTYKCPAVGSNCSWTGRELEEHYNQWHEAWVLIKDHYLELSLDKDVTRYIFHKFNDVNFILRVKSAKHNYISFILFHFQTLNKDVSFTLELSNTNKTRKYTEKIGGKYCVSVNDDRFDWNKKAMFEIDIEKIAHLVKCDPKIIYSIKVSYE